MAQLLLKFLLVPDSSAARRVRRLIAEQGAGSGVIVGSWPELLDWARRAYLLPVATDDWGDAFAVALGEVSDAFWSESLSVAPAETSATVASAWMDLLSATDPSRGFDDQALETLPERPRRHLGDLIRLTRVLAERLPPELGAIRDLLATEAANALYTLRVTHVVGVPALSRWQAALVDKLNADAGQNADAGAADEALENILKSVLVRAGDTGATGACGVLQARLYQPSATRAALDDSVQWVGVRDFLQEAEVAAGMVQTLLAEHADLKPAEIGLLVPDSFEYTVAVEDAFRLGGIALSGLPVERWHRDLGREAVFHFLYCRQKPAPAMALAVCLSSPLMPWSRATGATLAQAVMEGNYELRLPAGASQEARAMLDALRLGDSEPASLLQGLQGFVDLLAGGKALAGHVQQARAAVAQLRVLLTGATELDWRALRRAVIPKLATTGETPAFNLEGVTVWRESQEPWRTVRHLIVLGFAQDHYPAGIASNPVFSSGDLEEIRKSTGLPVRTPTEALSDRRERFLRQLRAVSQSIAFLVPRRDPAGDAQAPSESLVFMHQLFVGSVAADGLITDLDAADERARARHVPLIAPEPPHPPRRLLAEDLSFDRDLLALRVDANGQQKPESPSSLETLMVSRLAWLLRRLDAEPVDWAPESLDPMLLGTLAHKVFEGLFRKDAGLPPQAEITGQVERLLDDAIRQLAPFLRASQWDVERRHFAAQTSIAARAWRDALEQLGAEVLGSEEWIAGTWAGISIHGQTDLILGLPGGRLLVVDYKRSKSTKRLAQMQKGYDSQASLYREMLRSGGPKNKDNTDLISRIRAAAQTGVVYYLLNDQVQLCDTELPGSAAVPGWRTINGDIAGQAMALIEQRIGEVRNGRLLLNREDDATFFEKQAGITPYALDSSPLIRLFTLPSDVVAES